jgi:hypothetical protein
LQRTFSAIYGEVLAELLVAQQLHTLGSAFLRAAPKSGFFVFSIQLQVLGCALRAKYCPY